MLQPVPHLNDHCSARADITIFATEVNSRAAPQPRSIRATTSGCEAEMPPPKKKTQISVYLDPHVMRSLCGAARSRKIICPRLLDFERMRPQPPL
jgi:hypothetical protein